MLGTLPVRSHLVHELVKSERAYADAQPAERWEDAYAARVAERFG